MWNEIKAFCDDFFYDRKLWIAVILVLVFLELACHYPYK